MSETLVRIVGKILITRHAQVARDLLVPTHVGVAVSNGGHAVSFLLRHLLDEHRGRNDVAVLQVDFTNAFNLVSRQAIRRSVRTHFPAMCNYFCFCYDIEPAAPLLCEDSIIWSMRGVRQGMIESPMFFAAILHDLMTNYLPPAPPVPEGAPSTPIVAYLNDVHVFGAHN